MELVTTNTDKDVTVIEPTTTRSLTVTVKVDKTADIDTIVNNLKEFGEVSNVSYYEQTYNAPIGGQVEGPYLY